MEENMNEISSNNNVAKKRALTVEEQSLVEPFKQKMKKKTIDIFKPSKEETSDAIELVLEEDLNKQDCVDLVQANIMAATGSTNFTVGINLLTNIGQALTGSNAKKTDKARTLNTIAHSMQVLEPQDEYEGQLVGQLIVLHDQAMDWLGKAKRTERVDFANIYLNGASKLLTRHHETLDTLLKYRRKGEQKVHVEHVHVHGGGQAIVGNVATGRGMKPILEEAPHAKV